MLQYRIHHIQPQANFSVYNKENLERYEQTKMEGGIEQHLPKTED